MILTKQISSFTRAYFSDLSMECNMRMPRQGYGQSYRITRHCKKSKDGKKQNLKNFPHSSNIFPMTN